MISVTTPLHRAMDRTKQVLFEPFDAAKWFTLGFCAFLATLSGGGVGGGFRGGNFNPLRGSGRSGTEDFDQALSWIHAHMQLLLSLGLAILVLGLALGLLLMWLGSRGQFMFLDGVLRNRGAVTEPWERFRRLGNSLFTFHAVLGFGFFAFLLVLLAMGWAIARPDIAAHTFGSAAITAIAVPGCLLMLVASPSGSSPC